VPLGVRLALIWIRIPSSQQVPQNARGHHQRIVYDRKNCFSGVSGIGAKPLLLSHQCYPVVPQFESKDSFGIAVRAIAFEPSGSSKGTVASEIREGRQITTLNLRSLLHPRRIVLNVLPNLRPAA